MELFSIDLEQAVLGSCIKNNTLVDRASAVIGEMDFYDPLHQRIFLQLEKMHGLGEQINPASLSAAMKEDPGIKDIGTEYFSALHKASPELPNIVSLSRGIKEFATKRSIISMAEQIAENIGDGTSKEHIENAERTLYALAEKNHYGAKQITFSQAIKLATAQAEKAQNNGGKLTGLATGLTEIDKLLGGLQNSDLTIIAGRPGMGKTALATNMAHYLAATAHPVLFFSLEMSASQLSGRILSDVSGVEAWKIRNGQMRPQEWDDYILTGQKLDSMPLYIDDTGGLSLPQVCARARRAKREHKIEALVIDYLQLMNGNRKDGNRVQEVTEITKGLKALAKELDIPILALSQLSRGVDSRDDKRPVLSDLRESGSIEQDADIVMFVYREEYYTKSREPDIADPNYSNWQEKMEKCHGKADVIVEKHRHGPTGAIHLGFDGRFTRFHDLPE